jgi:hypothetical protein
MNNYFLKNKLSTRKEIQRYYFNKVWVSLLTGNTFNLIKILKNINTYLFYKNYKTNAYKYLNIYIATYNRKIPLLKKNIYRIKLKDFIIYLYNNNNFLNNKENYCFFKDILTEILRTSIFLNIRKY